MYNQQLFHPRTLKKAIESSSILINGQVPKNHLDIVKKRISNQELNSKRKEKDLREGFFRDFKEILGYKFPDDIKNAKLWNAEPEYKSIDYALGLFTKNEKLVLVPFELKGPDTPNLTIPMKGRKESTVEQAVRYAEETNGTAKWFLVSNCVEIRLYKYGRSRSQFEQWFISDLIKPEEYARFVLLLSADNLLTGKTEKLFEASLQQEKDISNELYQDYRNLRIDLINRLKQENNSLRRKNIVRLAQKLLDRMLFIAFAEDRGLLAEKTLQSCIEGDFGGRVKKWTVIKELFLDIDQGNKERDIPAYNGGLFKKDVELESLSVSDSLLEVFKELYKYDFDSDVGTHILGHIFEQSIADLEEIYAQVDEEKALERQQASKLGTKGKRKKDGVVYTPEFVTSYIVEKTLGGYLSKRFSEIKHSNDSLEYWLDVRKILSDTKVVDPACGSGAFLITAFKFLKEQYEQVNQQIMQFDNNILQTDLFGLDLNKQVLNNNLFGVDLNPESVEITQLALWLETAERGKKLNNLDNNIQQGNSIISAKQDAPDAFNWNIRFGQIMKNGGFDVVLGNPPYVRQERLKEIKPILERNYQTFNSIADLYTYFFELGLTILKKGGRLGYISSSTFFRTGSGESLRRFLSIKADLDTIIDFGDYQVFEGVTTYPAILIMDKPQRDRANPPKDHEFSFLNVQTTKDQQDKALQEEMRMSFAKMKQANLKYDAWQLEDNRLAQLREKITKGKKTLKDVYGSLYRGLLTGLNEAFVIDEVTYQNLKKDDPEGKFLKPFLEGKDLKKWRAESRNLYLILFKKGFSNEKQTEAQAWEALTQKYPNIAAHLFPFAGKARKRCDQGNFWWELRACAYYDDFAKNKIVWGNLQNKASFCLDSSGFYINAPSPILILDDDWLVGYLNSNLSWFALNNIAIARNGGFIECKPVYINQIPIPAITDEQKEVFSELVEKVQSVALKRYQHEKAQQSLIISLCPIGKEKKLNQKLISWWDLEDLNELKKEAVKSFVLKKGESLAIDLDAPKNIKSWTQDLIEAKEKWHAYTKQILALENEINQKVYALFDLTPEEIELLEASL